MLRDELLNKGQETDQNRNPQIPNNKGKLLGAKNIFQSITYSFLNPVMDTGAEYPYQNEMLYDVSPDFCYLPGKTTRHLDILNKEGKITSWTVMKTIKPYLLVPLITCLTGNLSYLFVPYKTREIIQWLGEPEARLEDIYPSLIILIVCVFLMAYSKIPLIFYHYRMGVVVRNALSILFLQKLVNFPPTAKAYIDYGKLAVMIDGDISKVALGSMWYPTVLETVFILGFAVYFMFTEIGLLCLIPLIMGLVTFIGQQKLSKLYVGQDKIRRGYVDKKSTLVTETVTGMKNLKFNAWELIHKNKSVEIRKKEKGLLKNIFFYQGLQMALVSCITPICCLIVFAIIFLTGWQELDVSKIYTVIMLFSFIENPLSVLGSSVFYLASSGLSMKRLNTLMSMKEYKPGTQDKGLPVGTVSIRKANFSWDDPYYAEKLGGLDKKKAKKTSQNQSAGGAGSKELASISICLRDIELEVSSGQFVSVIGKVGSGKSSLLSSILDSMKTVSGSVAINGKLAFIPQDSFLLNDTLRNNILFGKRYNEEWYYKVIDACQLDADIAMLPRKDQNEIGERGINLSGGQKQRVAIARAVYSRSDIYLIDDSLSALDAEVGKKILEGVFMGLLREKTIIMTTNHLFFLEKTDEILVMKDGRIAARGDYQSVKSSPEYSEILQRKIQIEKEEEEERASKSSRGFSLKYSKEKKSKIEEKEHLKQEVKNQEQIQKERKLQAQGKLTSKEGRSVGIVGWRIYAFYLRLAGGCIIISLVILAMSATFLELGVNTWAGKWAQHSFESFTNLDYLWIFLGLIFTFFLMSIAKYNLFSLMISKCSYRIFIQVFWNVLRRPMSFFDTTNSGVIINRCTNDVEITDFKMPRKLMQFTNYTFVMLGSFILTGISTPFFLVVLLPVMFLLGKYVEKFLRTSTELRRLIRLSKSPILTTTSELVNGLTTIRAYEYQENMSEKWRKFHNISQKVFLHEIYAQAWITYKSEMTLMLINSAIFVFIVFGKVYKFNTTNDPAILGMLMASVFNIGSILYRLLNSFGELANSINVIERLKEYIEDENFVKEFDTPKIKEVSGGRGLVSWPSEGKIEVENVKVRYRAGLPYVLNGLSFRVAGGNKVGIVGRTGSGKSTLILCLMRILELEHPTGEGSISIDGVDIGSIGLHVLRKNITIIPQEPYIVEGSLRFNIDPLEEYTDREVISALEKVELFETLLNQGEKKELPSIKEDQAEDSNINPETDNMTDSKKKDLLNFSIELGGKNLSQGQKQLICIARALVAKPKILLMDEATSSIDQKSDSIVQRVIKKELDGTTVISIAHRLVTIIQYDQLVVLKNGVKVEQGSPLKLINNGGYFCSLVEEGGQEYKKKMIYCAKNREVDPSTIL